jgi:hypothetical protein
MVLEVVFCFPVIACARIQHILARQSWIPGISLQCSGRARIDAASAAAAKVTLYRLPAGNGYIRENGPQANPRAILAGYKLAVAADPTQACTGGRGLVWKVALDVYGIGAF